MIRGFAPTIGLLAVIVPAIAHAQTNLDQGKSAAQIFAADCAECHKAARGLANGKNNATLTDFLREHYTTSREQAAALAAYVLGGRGSEPVGTAAQGRSAKPAPERASASAEEPKPSKRQAPHGAKPEEAAHATAKLQRPEESGKPEDEASPSEVPSIMAPEPRPASTSRSRHKEPKEPKESKESKAGPTEAPAAVAHEPAAGVPDVAPAETPSETPTREASPNPPPSAAAAPADAASGESGETAPVPRDDIPD